MSNKGKSGVGKSAIKDLNKKHEEKEADKESRKKAFETAYKNILWIDDRDQKDAKNDPLEWMLKYCDEDTCMQIEQVDLFADAVDRIINNSSCYDLVIFDINLEDGFTDIHEDQITKIEDQFKNYHIRFSYNKVNRMHAGYYLFKLLLAVGYPLDRMLIFSGHATEEKAQQELQDIIINERIYTPKENGKLNIEDKFFSKKTCSYYRIRRLVYQACAYWDKQIENTSKFPFNELYSLEIDKKTFSGMLEHIKMLFPVKRPSNPLSVYYRAMQIVAAFHEENADLFNKSLLISNYPKLRKYHLCIRNFRNWSSHNKMKPELNGESFALLLCIALRTYFMWESDKNLNTDLLPYEALYRFNRTGTVNRNELKKKLYKAWKEIHEILNNGDVKEKYKGFYRDLNKAIHNLGYVKGVQNMERYLFLPIWISDFETQLDISDNDTYVIFSIKRGEIDALINSSNAKGADACFMLFGYQWVYPD